jgi:hypothetical protein
MPAVLAFVTLTVVVATLVMALTAVVVPPEVGNPTSMMLSSADSPVVLATVNVRSAELLTLAVR